MIVSNFGATGVTGQDCPAGGDETEWCNCVFPADVDPINNGKCKAWRPGAPWTVIGAGLRGIPHLGSDTEPTGGIINAIARFIGGGTTSPAATPVVTDDGIFGIPRTIAIVGGGVLLLGGAAFMLSRTKKRSGAVAGYRRRRTRRR